MNGFVYCFRMVETPFYKIGMTNSESVKDRFNTFKTYCPNGAEIICVIKTSNARKLELNFHNEFKSKRFSGEFFKLDELDIERFKSYQDEELININNFFWLNVYDLNISFSELNNVFNQLKINRKNKNEGNEDIYSFLSDEWSNTWLSNSEIISILKDAELINDNMSPYTLGRMLKNKYTQKIKNIEGLTKRLYYIE